LGFAAAPFSKMSRYLRMVGVSGAEKLEKGQRLS
jgi:hypothetical protein